MKNLITREIWSHPVLVNVQLLHKQF